VPKKTPPRAKPLYRRKPPRHPHSGRAVLPRRQADQQVSPTNDIPHAHLVPPAHFALREDGSIQKIKGSATVPVASFGVPPNEMVGTASGVTPNGTSEDVSGETPNTAGGTPALPRLIFSSDSPFLRLYHGNSLELLDAIAAKYPDGRFDAIFADPPYFLSNGGITCHAGKMVKVDKGDWDKSRGPELNHEFNLEWLKRCQRVLKPNGTIWVTGTHHVIFSIGYAMQQLGYKILNDIAWEKPNPPPNLSCRYFTHSTETVLWAAKNEKSKHVFNYQEMRKVTGKQMKTVWRKEEFEPRMDTDKHGLKLAEKEFEGRAELLLRQAAQQCGPTEEKEIRVHPCSSVVKDVSSVWTLSAPGSDEKTHGKHPTQKPVALVERCLLASTNEGDLVLDPFLGNGTTAVASLRLKRGCVGIELDLHHVEIAARRADREIIEIWLRHFRVRMEISVVGRAGTPLPAAAPNANDRRARSDAPYHNSPRPQTPDARPEIDLAIFPDSINGSRDMTDVPEIQTERIFHECKFVFLSCAQVERGAVVHTTVDVSLQEAWAKTPNGKKRETTHIVRCETEIFWVKSS
jgi:site-specific DNA-methyltransferase (adenine-specific)